MLFCFRCGISKSSEGAPCKCSTPSIRVNEIVEDPTGDNWQAPPINSDDPLMVYRSCKTIKSPNSNEMLFRIEEVSAKRVVEAVFEVTDDPGALLTPSRC